MSETYRKCPLCRLNGVYFKAFSFGEDMFICRLCNFAVYAHPDRHCRKDKRALVALGKINDDVIQVRELVCQRCDVDYQVWYADDELWNLVADRGQHFLCPTCFVDQSALKGGKALRLTVEKNNKRLLADAARVIEQLAEQQAMPDDFYTPVLAQIKDCIAGEIT